MTSPKGKPQGKTGPIRFGTAGSSWEVIKFPEAKPERELMIARLFVGAFHPDRTGGWVENQSEPSLAPFGELRQNAENDIDFSIGTRLGDMLMELAEFAPLQQHGPRFADAPKSIDLKEKANLAATLIEEKSAHQGGKNRFLVVYATEYVFRLEELTIERLRRHFAESPPRFERVYFIATPHETTGFVTEIYPGVQSSSYADVENLDEVRLFVAHPTDWVFNVSPDGVASLTLRPPITGDESG